MHASVFRLAILLVALTALCGCGDGSNRKPLFPTEGKLLIKGQPAGGVTVFLHSTDPNETEPTRPFATTNPDGTFTVTTVTANDGAPAGEYVVTLLYEPLDSPLTRAKGKPPSIDKKYANPKTSPLRAVIEAKAQNTLAPFDVR
ncbi:MAG: carboxypeptidase-like regulatory domain-containing protein [Gemmataceae bacterium]|nr:carboxypeptidase-like regulatory domain-containing protein [Gemmataceae bacterium]